MVLGVPIFKHIKVHVLLLLGIGVPILLGYVYGVVPISLCRSGGCGITTTDGGGVRFEFEENETGIPSGMYPCKYLTENYITLKCLSIGTPKNNKFSICPKWKIHYFQVSQNLSRVQPHYNMLEYWDT